MSKATDRVRRAAGVLRELAIGGTAVGTGLNTHPEFAGRVCVLLSAKAGMPFCEAQNHFEAQAARDDSAEVAGPTRIRLGVPHQDRQRHPAALSSGPRAGLGELTLPALQPGSSIMPGKVNPVLCEMLVQVGLYVQGLVQTVMSCCRDGQLELNATIPLIAHCLHACIHCLANGARVFAEGCVRGIEADAARCEELMDRSLMVVTALNPYIGYDAGVRVAKEAFSTGRTIREVVLGLGLMDAGELDKALDPRKDDRAHPHLIGRGSSIGRGHRQAPCDRQGQHPVFRSGPPNIMFFDRLIHLVIPRFCRMELRHSRHFTAVAAPGSRLC